MRPYGLNEFGMRGCCPGHDDFPRESYKGRRSIRAHRTKTKIMRRRERRLEKRKLKNDEHM